MTPLHHRPDAIERASERRDESNSHASCGAKAHECHRLAADSTTLRASRRVIGLRRADTIEVHDHDDNAGPRGPANTFITGHADERVMKTW